MPPSSIWRTRAERRRSSRTSHFAVAAVTALAVLVGSAAFPIVSSAAYEPHPGPYPLPPNPFFEFQFYVTPGPLLNETLGTFLTSFDVSGTCVPEENSTFAFRSEGSAFGPYRGTYVDSGTFTVGPGSQPPTKTGGVIPVALAGFESNFTITPDAADFDRVVGQISMPAPVGAAYCTEATNQHGAVRFGGGTLHYEADIYLPDGSSFHDSGELYKGAGAAWQLCDKDKDHADDIKDKCEFKILK